MNGAGNGKDRETVSFPVVFHFQASGMVKEQARFAWQLVSNVVHFVI